MGILRRNPIRPLAVLAALVALGWQESVVDALLGGKLADSANALVTAALFAAVYLVLRILLDQLVPGNVRFPIMVDKIGAPVMGAITGIFASGILVIALQMLPFGPSILGYERYPSDTKHITAKLPGQSQQTELTFNELKTESWNSPTGAMSLMVPVDDWVLGFFNFCNAGLFATDNAPFNKVHPDYLKELFGQRLGIESGARHVALKDTVAVRGVYLNKSAGSYLDQEMFAVRAEQFRSPVKSTPGKAVTPEDIIRAMPKPPLLPDPPTRWLTLRTDIDAKNSLVNSDSDKLFRFSPASVRLVIGGVNYFCQGTLASNLRLVKAQPDDFLLAEGKNIDFVFEVPKEVFGDPKAKELKLPPDTFLEVKRLARVDLSNKVPSIDPPKVVEGVQMVYKKDFPISVGMMSTTRPATRPATSTAPATPPTTP